MLDWIESNVLDYFSFNCFNDFIDKDEKTNDFPQWKVAIEKEHIDIVIAQIRDSYDKIMKHQFNTGCGKPDCYWCNFVKENHLTVESKLFD